MNLKTCNERLTDISDLFLSSDTKVMHTYLAKAKEKMTCDVLTQYLGRHPSKKDLEQVVYKTNPIQNEILILHENVVLGEINFSIDISTGLTVTFNPFI